MLTRMLSILVLVVVLNSCAYFPPESHHPQPLQYPPLDPSQPVIRERYTYTVYEREMLGTQPLTIETIEPEIKCHPFVMPHHGAVPSIPSFNALQISDAKVAEIMVTHVWTLRDYIDDMETKLHKAYEEHQAACK